MSGIVGKGSRSYTKLAVSDSAIPAVGFKKLVWMHEASVDDTIIDLSSLTAPSEATANGFVQPSISDLTATNLQQFKENLTLTSSRGIWNQFIDYIVIGANKLLLLVPAEEGEIFRGVIDLEARTGTTIVDAVPISVSKILLAGTTDVNVGVPFETNKYSTSQHGAVQVFADGQLMYRNEGNQPDGDGDYYEVAGGAGLSTIIRFNTADTEDRQISIISTGSLVERPSGSQQAYLDALQGQLNVVTEAVEELAGLSPGDLSSTPTTADLEAFGDRVFANEGNIESLSEPGDLGSPKLASSSVEGAVKKNKRQEKTLSANVTSGNPLTDLHFSNLVVGKRYRVKYNIQAQLTATGAFNFGVVVTHNSSTLFQIDHTGNGNSGNTFSKEASRTFIATNTTVTTSFSSTGTRVNGNGTFVQSWASIEEINNEESTSEF